MRVALCLSGQLRDFDLTVASLRSMVLERIDGELHVFAHFARDEDFPKIWHLDFTAIKCEVEPRLDEKNYHVNHRVVDRPWNLGKQIQTYLRQLRSVFEANRLKSQYEEDNGFVYDWVIRARFDNEYLTPIEELSSLYSRNFYVPPHDNWAGYNDRFCFSSSANMDYYAARYLAIDEYFEGGRNELHPETFLKWHLDRSGIPVLRTGVIHNLRRYGVVWTAKDFMPGYATP
jgi:hypothetical protein